MKQSLSDIINILLILLIVVGMWGGLFFIVGHMPRTATYDCRIAEISPDIPLDVKQECRKIRMIKE